MKEFEPSSNSRSYKKIADKHTEIFYTTVRKKRVIEKRKSYDGHFVFIHLINKLVKRSINYTNLSFLRRCISLLLKYYLFTFSELVNHNMLSVFIRKQCCNVH